MKQEELESFLGFHKRIYCNGGDCIKIYKKYMAHREQFYLDTVMGHNMEDLLGLGKVFEMLGYLKLKEGGFKLRGSDFDGESLILQAALPYSLPAPFSNSTEEFYITGQENIVSIMTYPVNGRIRQYYSDYKKYDYLPGEDMAVSVKFRVIPRFIHHFFFCFFCFFFFMLYFIFSSSFFALFLFLFLLFLLFFFLLFSFLFSLLFRSNKKTSSQGNTLKQGF